LRRDRRGAAKARRAAADAHGQLRHPGRRRGRQRAQRRGRRPTCRETAGQEEEVAEARVPAGTEHAAMADPRFFTRAGPYSLGALATLSGATLRDGADGERRFIDVAPLETAGPDDVTFLDNRKYLDEFTR